MVLDFIRISYATCVASAQDLRQAPPAVRAWLRRVHALDETFAVDMTRAFDIIYYNQIDPPTCRP